MDHVFKDSSNEEEQARRRAIEANLIRRANNNDSNEGQGEGEGDGGS
jgi:hypothetical protein